MLLFKMDHHPDSCGVNIRGECCQVGPMFLQGDGMPRNEVGQGKRGVRQRKEIGCFGDVEGQKWMHASHCEVWRTTHTLVDCHSVSPHDRGDDGMPPQLVSITGLE